MKADNSIYVPLVKNVTQFFQAIPPLKKAGILRTGTPTQSFVTLNSIHRWGMSFASLIEQAAAFFPNRTFIVDDFGSLTFIELRDQARALSLNLKSKGLHEGDRIALMVRNSRAPILGLCAAGYLGLQPMILNVGSSATQIRNTIRDYNASLLFIDAEYFSSVITEDFNFPCVIVGEDKQNDSADADTLDELVTVTGTSREEVLNYLPKKPTQQETIIMSSGTYGIPKGVVLPVARTPKVLGGITDGIPWEANMIVQLTASMFHAWGWLNAQLALATGSTLILRRYYDPHQAVADCLKYSVNAIVSAAVFLRDFVIALDEDHAELQEIKFIASSGNVLPPQLTIDLINRFGPVVCNFYGSTEHGQIALASGLELAKDPRVTGHRLMGVELKVLREDGTEAAVGEIGRVFSANSMTMRGFLSSRDKIETHKGLLFTGDLGYFSAGGMLYLKGRNDDMVIKGGENVFPREIEEFLSQQEGINDVFVIGNQNDIVATLDVFIVKDEKARDEISSEEFIRQLIGKNLAAHNIPDRIFWVDKLPRNESGKVVPRELYDMV